MKIATRNNSDLTAPVHMIEVNGTAQKTRVVQEIHLRRERSYEVFAVEFPVGQAPGFRVLSEGFEGRVADGLVYPDLIAAKDCRIVDAGFPPGWVMRTHDVQGGAHSILGAPLLTEAGFMERLIDGEPVAVKLFLKLIDGK